MSNKEYEFEYENKNYPFLKVPKPQKKEEYEVTEYHMNLIRCKYSFYKSSEAEIKRRVQRSMSGFCISKNDYQCTTSDMASLDVSADILTAVSAFKTLRGTEEYKVLQKIYHCCGNVLPVCEGGNIGGRPKRDGNSLDFYSRKLKWIKDAFENSSCVGDFQTELGDNQKKIGRNRIFLFSLWIKWDWINKDKKWKDFVYENYLDDFVDEKINIIEFSSDIVFVTKQIIKRSYRINNNIHGKLEGKEEKKLEECYNQLLEMAQND